MSKMKEQLAGFKTKLDLITLARHYLEAGGTREAWIEAIDEAVAAMPGGGQNHPVQQDHDASAPARQPLASGTDHTATVQQDHRRPVPPAREPIPGEDQNAPVQQDHARSVPAGKPIPGGGHSICVQQDQSFPAPARNPIASGKATEKVSARTNGDLPPAREPSPQDRTAITRVADRTFLETVKIRGRLFGGYRWKDLKDARSLNLYENIIIAGALEWRKNKRVKDDDKIDDTMPEAALREIVNHAKRSIHSQVSYA